MLKLALILLLTGCSLRVPDRAPDSLSVFEDWQSYIEKNVFQKVGLENIYPDPAFLGPWWSNDDFVLSGGTPSRIRERGLNCPSVSLYPTHPSQATKDYLHAMYSQYNHANLPPTSYACLTRTTTNRHCLRAAIAEVVVMSDTYVDDCGNLYRGYWVTTYLKSDENMGTLFSRGRSAYPKPNAQFPGEFIDDNTYALTRDQFLLLGEILPGDGEKIRIEEARALKSGFKKNGKLFVR